MAVARPGGGRRAAPSLPPEAALALLLLLLAALGPAPAHAGVARRLLVQVKSCTPLAVSSELRCQYVLEQDACQPEGGLINYLQIHYCYLDQL